MTNPPFGSLLGADALTRLGAFDLARGRTNAPLEVLGLERSIQFLRPGGRLAIVVPEGILVNRAMRHVRDWLSSQVKIRGIVSLPIETFVPFGAGIKTSILFGRKWKAGEKSNEDYGVFLGRADNVGYDASGRTRTGCELEELNDRFTSFVDSEGW